MGRPLRIEFSGACYHITSRGNEKKDIYKTRADRERFLGYLESAVFRYGAVIHAWCLMTNHYHLLLETPRGNLSQIMRHINGAYTNYFNARRKRAGHLFQGRYKAILIEADEYLVELSRYIHLNPVRAGIISAPEEYPWSSYGVFAGLRQPTKWQEIQFILGYFDNQSTKYRQFVESLLGKEYESPLLQTVAATVLGSKPFVKQVTQTHLAKKPADRNLPAIRQLAKSPRLIKILMAARQNVVDENTARKTAIYLAHRYSGASLKELGACFGLSESGVSQASRRFAMLIERDMAVKQTVEGIIQKWGLSWV